MARGARLLLLLAFLAALLAVLLQLYRLRKPKLWTLDELSSSVFDVTKGRSHYGPGGGYHHFAGRDASRAFVSGNFTGDGLTDFLQGLSSMEVNSIVDWRKMYFEKYIYAGKLVGRYYDKQGNPTKYLKGVEVKAKRGAQLLEKQKNEEAKIPSCNSKWSEQEGGEVSTLCTMAFLLKRILSVAPICLVWCDTGYPRLVRRPGDIALTGKVNQRCACFQEEELNKPGVVVYEGCDYLSTSCKVN
ncbi:hypothetical protein PR202_ga26680 [Eleusine coracana subsp. coracana]|uniref:Cytochrome b5 heme-binding domain-containing protein n=1 Tax=Eleusine coracana subsp. coracana TaxID=191504 RepID=A0AAV5DF41_ELECO|nr:hypothetical protein PR202_ga26680 [Eleusine coracana subsp. coracana]